MFKRCPDCEKQDLEIIDRVWSNSGELYEVNVYRCNNCGCEFDEEEADDIRNDEEEFGN